MIELSHLTKKFGDLVAVNDLTLKVQRGEFFAVLGPNAAGKTTLHPRPGRTAQADRRHGARGGI